MSTQLFRIRIEILLLVLGLFLSVNTQNGDRYDELISRADIFYVPPEPNSNPNQIRISELSSVRSRKNIKIVIHGYIADSNYVAVQPLRFAYLNQGHDSLYMADFRDAGQVFYLTSRYFVERLGRRFGKLLDTFMRKHQIYAEDVHILGHSLGAHIAGTVGRYFNGQIGRITGLDAAGPLFGPNAPDGLRSSDALFVDTIHSDYPFFGEIIPRGHADFYPNYGTVLQPGCGTLDWLLLSSCSHFRAPLFYAESIVLPNSFPSIPCSLKDIERNNCEKHKASNLVMMGENIDHNTRGTFYLKTNNVPPYGMGNFSQVLSQTSVNNNEKIFRRNVNQRYLRNDEFRFY